MSLDPLTVFAIALNYGFNIVARRRASGSLAITPRFGATNQTPKPSAEINLNGVSAYSPY
jgi:hypothetical protein